MASTFSPLKIELITTGEQSGTWGNTTNVNLGTALEEAIVGRANAAFPSDVDLTLTLTDSNTTQVARNFILNVTSSVSLTTTRNLIVPAINKPYIVENNTTGAQSIVVKTAAGTGVTVPNGAKVMVYADGTNVVSATTHISSLTLGAALPVASGGTGSTTVLGAQQALNLKPGVDVQPYDATILNSSAIGVTVQAYDAALARLNLSQNFTAPQRGDVVTDNDLSFDLSAKQNFTCTPIAGGTLTFTGLVAGLNGNILLVNGSNYAIAKAASVKCNISFLTTVSATGTYWISYYSDGTSVYVSTAGAAS